MQGPLFWNLNFLVDIDEFQWISKDNRILNTIYFNSMKKQQFWWGWARPVWSILSVPSPTPKLIISYISCVPAYLSSFPYFSPLAPHATYSLCMGIHYAQTQSERDNSHTAPPPSMKLHFAADGVHYRKPQRTANYGVPSLGRYIHNPIP